MLVFPKYQTLFDATYGVRNIYGVLVHVTASVVTRVLPTQQVHQSPTLFGPNPPDCLLIQVTGRLTRSRKQPQAVLDLVHPVDLVGADGERVRGEGTRCISQIQPLFQAPT